MKKKHVDKSKPRKTINEAGKSKKNSCKIGENTLKKQSLSQFTMNQFGCVDLLVGSVEKDREIRCEKCFF